MSFQNKVRALMITAGALALILLIDLIVSAGGQGKRLTAISLMPAGTSLSSVASIDIQGAESISLRYKSQQWMMERGNAEAPVTSTRVEYMLKAIDKVVEMLEVGSSKDDWFRFQLDEANASRVTIRDTAGNLLADFWAGKYDVFGKNEYVRIEGQDTVYQADSEMGSYIKSESLSWQDKRLFAGYFDDEQHRDSIQNALGIISVKASLSFTGGDKEKKSLDYKIDVPNMKISAKTNFYPDLEKVKALVRRLSDMNGEEWNMDPNADTGLDKPQATIEWSVSQQDILGKRSVQALPKLLIGKEDSQNRFYIKLENFSSRPWVLIVSESLIRELLAEPETLMGIEPSPSPKASLVGPKQ